MANESILWRRLDRPGHEAARLSRHGSGWRLAGTAVFADDGRPCAIEYLVVCDPNWRTTSAQVAGWLGHTAVEVEIAAQAGQWECLDAGPGRSTSTGSSPTTRRELPTQRL